MKAKEEYTTSIPQSIEEGLKDAGIDTYHGFAQFQDEATILVGKQELTADQFFIATGAKPRPFDFVGADQLLTNVDFLEVESLPQTIAFLGGGYISFDFAHLAARAGADVHIIESGEQPLKAFDKEHVDELIQLSKDLGITFHWNWKVEQLSKSSNGVVVTAGSDQLEVDAIFHGAGRIPNIEALNTNKANIETDKGGIIVNEYL